MRERPPVLGPQALRAAGLFIRSSLPSCFDYFLPRPITQENEDGERSHSLELWALEWSLLSSQKWPRVHLSLPQLPWGRGDGGNGTKP